jgi:hypothetical protein
MARKKLSSRVVKSAERRASGIQNIDPNLDLGGELTLPNYRAAISALATKVKRYNSLLSALDTLLSEIKTDEVKLSDLSAQMLRGICCRFGSDSLEYTQAGGTRRSDRKRPTRRIIQTPPTDASGIASSPVPDS